MIDADGFAARLDRSGTHHLWLGATDSRGRGQIRIDGRLRTAARVAWELARGPVPAGYRVRSCPDEARCVRIDHLRIEQHGRPQPARAPRGGGSLRQLGSGRWKLVVDAGRDDTGRRRRVTRNVHGTRSEATRALAALTVDVQTGRRRPVPIDGASVDDLVDWYFDFAREVRGLARTTVAGYRTIYRRWLKPRIGDIPADRLTAARIDEAFGAMRSAGLSRGAMNSARSALSGAYRWGRRHGRVVADPMRGTELPRSVQTPRRPKAPEAAELLRVLEEAARSEPDLWPVLMLAAVTGMRRGELAGLRRDRLRLGRGELTVDRSISEIDGAVEEKPTKTHASRTVRVDPVTVEMLADHLAAMDARAEKLLGVAVPGDGFVFSLEPDCSRPMRPEFMTRRMRQLSSRVGSDVTMMSLRKWTSSELMDSGFSPAAVSERQGHTVQVLLGSYSARRASADQAAADHLGGVIHRRDRPDPGV